VKLLLPVMLLAVFSATSYAADKSVSGYYLLLYPSSTIETDLGGDCVRVRNMSHGLVYLSTTVESQGV